MKRIWSVISVLLIVQFVSCRSVIEKIVPGRYEDPLKVDNAILAKFGAKPQYFTIDNSESDIIRGRQGTRIYIPANSFIDTKGNAVSGKIVIRLIEITKSIQLAGSDIPGMLDRNTILSSGSMVRFEALQNNKVIGVRDGKKIIGIFDLPDEGENSNSILPNYKSYKLDHHNEWDETSPPELDAFNFRVKTTFQIIDLKDKTVGVFSTPSLNHVKKLYITGTMNNWKVPGLPMRKNDRGDWEIELDASKEMKFKYFSQELDEYVVNVPEYHFHFIPGNFGQGGKLLSQNYRLLYNYSIDFKSVKLKEQFYYPVYNHGITHKKLIEISGKISTRGKKTKKNILIRNVLLDKTGSIRGDLSKNIFKDDITFTVSSPSGVRSRILVVDEKGNAGISDVITNSGYKELTIPNIVLKKVPKNYLRSQRRLIKYLKLTE